MPSKKKTTKKPASPFPGAIPSFPSCGCLSVQQPKADKPERERGQVVISRTVTETKTLVDLNVIDIMCALRGPKGSKAYDEAAKQIAQVVAMAMGKMSS